MPFIQFRIHPSVGSARMGNSNKAYYLASEFPQFMQEEFEHLRLKPRPRNRPVKFFAGDATLASASTTLTSFTAAPPAGFGGVYDATAAHQNRFKDTSGKIFPQAARFRVFAYVYDSPEAPHPATVFEVTAVEADILWKVNIANKKSEKASPPAPPPPLNRDENMTAVATTLDTASPTFTCQRLRPKAGLPNLGYMFLERDDANVSKVTGRLHVIGNEGEFLGSHDPASGPTDRTLLWSDDWYDSAADGLV